MTLSKYVHAMGRGPGRARHLTRDEAQDAMSQILAGTAEPEAVGALLMLMRYRGEIPEELAGFVDALRAHTGPWQGPVPALDWPSYAAGRSRGLPWFLLAAKLVAGAGYSVLFHGWNSHQGVEAAVRLALPHAAIGTGETVDEVSDILIRDGIAYLPLEAISPDGLRVLRLREVFGLRSAINTTLRLFNPAGAETSVQGVFHPPYRGLQTDTCALLNQPRQAVLKGAGGEFERAPAKTIQLLGLRNGAQFDTNLPPLLPEATGRLAEGTQLDTPQALADLWSGAVTDPYAETIVTGTAAAALLTLGAAPDIAAADRLAADLWTRRRSSRAA
ncbi:glycosyl transferase family protein [Chachezhania antarctica]|uniref:glycosyl transferase family protein n=1 Tax=Chachezhania antarctica TaxID=2340860 RepID=UPI000EB5972B|nr:glycosyl transferase family protein [Chachezhania antarctica]